MQPQQEQRYAMFSSPQAYQAYQVPQYAKHGNFSIPSGVEPASTAISAPGRAAKVSSRGRGRARSTTAPRPRGRPPGSKTMSSSRKISAHDNQRSRGSRQQLKTSQVRKFPQAKSSTRGRGRGRDQSTSGRTSNRTVKTSKPAARNLKAAAGSSRESRELLHSLFSRSHSYDSEDSQNSLNSSDSLDSLESRSSRESDHHFNKSDASYSSDHRRAKHPPGVSYSRSPSKSVSRSRSRSGTRVRSRSYSRSSKSDSPDSRSNSSRSNSRSRSKSAMTIKKPKLETPALTKSNFSNLDNSYDESNARNKLNIINKPNWSSNANVQQKNNSQESKIEPSVSDINNFFEEHASKRHKFYADQQAVIKRYIRAFEVAVKKGSYQNDPKRFDLITNFIQRFKDWKSASL